MNVHPLDTRLKHSPSRPSITFILATSSPIHPSIHPLCCSPPSSTLSSLSLSPPSSPWCRPILPVSRRGVQLHFKHVPPVSINTSISSHLSASRLLQILDEAHYLNYTHARRSQSRTRCGREPVPVTVTERRWSDFRFKLRNTRWKRNNGHHCSTWVSPLWKHKNEQIIRTYRRTQHQLQPPCLRSSSLQIWTHYPSLRSSLSPFCHPSILLQSAYFNWFHLPLFPLHCVLFPRILCLAIIYTYPAAPVHPSCLTSRLYIYHLQIETSIAPHRSVHPPV